MDAHLQYIEANVTERVGEIFRGCPELSGFTVQEETPVPGHLVYCMPVDLPYAEAVIATITRELLDLIDEEPDASALVLGRTFARTLH